MGDLLAFEAAGVVEVELLQRLAGREPGSPDAALAAVGFSGGDSRCRQAARNSSWVQPSALARSASRATEVRRVGAFSARVRKASSAARSRVGLAVVVVGQAANLDLVGVAADRSAEHGPVATQLGGGRQVSGVADRLVACPAARMVSDQPPVTERLDSVQVGADLDTAADPCWVDRVVVAVQPHVVVPWQPQ